MGQTKHQCQVAFTIHGIIQKVWICDLISHLHTTLSLLIDLASFLLSLLPTGKAVMLIDKTTVIENCFVTPQNVSW